MRAGDKVGLVGRNGAGKTSLLQGARRRGAGRRRRGACARAASATCPRTRASTARPTTPTALAHVLSGRGLDERRRAPREAAPAPSRRTRPSATSPASPGPRSSFRARRRLRGRVRGPPHRRRPRPRRRPARPARSACSPAASAAGSSWPASCSPAATCCCSTSPPTTSTSTPRRGCMGFLRAYRGALLVVSHDLELLDEAITRVLHLDEGDAASSTRAPTRSTSTRGATDEERLAQAGGAPGRPRSTACRRSPTRCGAQTAEAGPHGQEPRQARRAPRRPTRSAARPRERARSRCASPTPPHSGRVVLEVDGLAKSYGGPPCSSDVDVRRRPRRAAARPGPQRRRQDQPAAHPGRRDRAPTPARSASATACRSATTPRSTRASRAGATRARPHARAGRRSPTSELRGLLGMFGLTGEMAFQDAGTLSGGEKTKLALAQLVAGRHNLLLLDEPTNNLDPPSRDGDRPRRCAAWPGTMVLVSHDTEFVRRARARPGAAHARRRRSTTGATTCSTWSRWPERHRPGP